MENTSKGAAASTSSSSQAAGSSKGHGQSQPKPSIKINNVLPGHGATDDEDLAAPRQSRATQMLFRVMRQSVARLDGERDELRIVDNLLNETLKDVEKELTVNGKMLQLAKRALNFQTGTRGDDADESDEDDDDDLDLDIDWGAHGQEPRENEYVKALLEKMVTDKVDEIMGNVGEELGSGDGATSVAACEKASTEEGIDAADNDLKIDYVLNDLIDD